MADDTIGAMFARLDPAATGLDGVRRALADGDRPAAEAAYLHHYRDRRGPALPWNPVYHDGEGFAARSAHYDFFAEPPDGIDWRDRDRLRPLISREPGFTRDRGHYDVRSPHTVVALADLILDHKVYHPWWPQHGAQDLGPAWDWDHVPPDGDGAWTFHLHHQEFLIAPAQAYWQTGDARYARGLIARWTDWIDRVGRPVNLCHLIQPVLYQQLLPFALSWDGLSPRDFCKIQAWLATANADALMANERAGNQLMGTGAALLWLGVGMPEFAAAPRWRDEGLRRIGAFLGDGSSYPDGSAKEPCFHYAVRSCQSAARALAFARSNGVAVDAELDARVARAATFFARTARPDGSWVWNGNGARGSAMAFVAEVARAAEASSSAWFPYAGYGVMRAGGSADANYLFFDVGPRGTQHFHEAKLAVEVVAHGRPIVEDLGVHTYSGDARERPMKWFFMSTAAHNTVVVDGRSQMRTHAGPAVVDGPLENPWHSTAALDFLAGEYAEGWGDYAGFRRPPGSVAPPIDPSVFHRRSVAFVKAGEGGGAEYWIVTDRLVGAGSHEYEQLFHLAPTAYVADGGGAKIVRTTTPGRPNLAFVPAADDGLEVEVVLGRPAPRLQGWYVAAGSASPVPSPCVIYRRRGPTPAVFQTVLWPQRPGDAAVPTVEAVGPVGGGWLKITAPGGRTDVYCSPTAPGRHAHGGVTFDGVAVLVRFDRDGREASREVVAAAER